MISHQLFILFLINYKPNKSKYKIEYTDINDVYMCVYKYRHNQTHGERYIHNYAYTHKYSKIHIKAAQDTEFAKFTDHSNT